MELSRVVRGARGREGSQPPLATANTVLSPACQWGAVLTAPGELGWHAAVVLWVEEPRS
jgi:hypothetical protein